jgi:hypothetical protein
MRSYGSCGRLALLLLACLTRASSGLATPLQARQPGEFTDFRGRRVGFGSVKKVKVPLAGSSTAELEDYLTPERVACAMWDPSRVKRVDDDGRYELSMERLSFVMLEVESSVVVRVARVSDDMITLTSESFSVAAQSPAGRLSVEELGIEVSVAGVLQILDGGRAVGGQVGFETEGDLPGLMMLTPRPVVTAAAGGMNRAVMALVVGEFEKGMQRDFAAWRQQRAAEEPAAGAAPPEPAPKSAASGAEEDLDDVEGQGGWLL